MVHKDTNMKVYMLCYVMMQTELQHTKYVYANNYDQYLNWFLCE